MPKRSRPARILAIDPGIREMGFALFEGDSLVRYGVKNLRKERIPQRVLTKGKEIVLDLLERFSPRVLVLGNITHPTARENPALRKLITQTKLLARKRRIRVYEYEPSFARDFIANGQRATKRNVARLIASLYPELSGYIPGERRILWKCRDFYWVNVFDACTLAIAYLQKRNGRGKKHETKTSSE